MVAPRVGAWIETWNRRAVAKVAEVAPHAGAWIETRMKRRLQTWARWRLALARGLKLDLLEVSLIPTRSRPTHARGLKRCFVDLHGVEVEVARYVLDLQQVVFEILALQLAANLNSGDSAAPDARRTRPGVHALLERACSAD